MQNKDLPLKEKEGTQNQPPPLQENETILQFKVRTDIRSGQCPPGCVYNSEYNMCFCKMNPS